MVKVMVFGTFDGLHEGHLDFFKQAKEHGDYLIAVASRDVNIKKNKGHFSKRRDRERFTDLQNCKLVNKPILGYEDDVYRIIETLKPDVICLGYDQQEFLKDLKIEIKKRGLKLKIFQMKPFKADEMRSPPLKIKKKQNHHAGY